MQKTTLKVRPGESRQRLLEQRVGRVIGFFPGERDPGYARACVGLSSSDGYNPLQDNELYSFYKGAKAAIESYMEQHKIKASI